LKKSFELEDSFRSLDRIPRSQTQKRKTYNYIIQHSKAPSSYRSLFRNWTGLLMTFAMLIVCSGFLYIQIVSPANSQHSSIKPADYFAAGEVVRTYIGRANSEHYFSLKTSDLTMPGILSTDDKEWLNTINKALIGMEATTQNPPGKPAYDLLVIYDGREPAELKLWITGNEIYMKQIDSEEVFKIQAVQSQKIIETLSYIQRQVQF
jgi:hypothetical protein